MPNGRAGARPSASAASRRSDGSQRRAEEHVTYVYGIVPADVETDPEARGVGDPPGEIGVVRHGDIAALVSEFPAERSPANQEDKAAHTDLLDATAAEVPVLPVRFGAVMRDPDAVTEELLKANHDEFAAALRELEGRAEYVVKADYVGQVPAGVPDADAGQLAAVLEELGCPVKIRRPAEDDEAVHVACLAETERQDEPGGRGPRVGGGVGRTRASARDRADRTVRLHFGRLINQRRPQRSVRAPGQA